MIHAREAIRSAVVAALAAAGTAAGNRVDDHPYNPRRVFPSLVVEDLGANHSEGQVTESISLLTVAGTVHLGRVFRLCVIAEVQDADEAHKARDSLSGEVEQAIALAHQAGSIPAQSIIPIAYQSSDSNSGETKIRRGLTVFEIKFITSQDDPSTTL